MYPFFLVKPCVILIHLSQATSCLAVSIAFVNQCQPLMVSRSHSFLVIFIQMIFHVTYSHRKIKLVEGNAKCLHPIKLKKLTCKGTLRQLFICLRPPPLLGYCLGWSINFVGSESGQIQSVKLLKNMVSNRTQHPPPPTTHCQPERRLEGQ